MFGEAACCPLCRVRHNGHGYCTYDFFEKCPHRMACSKCAFYRPKQSTRAQVLEGRANLFRLGQEIPLGETELAAVTDGIEAHERLVEKPTDVPTPAGPMLRDLFPRVQQGTSPANGDRSRLGSVSRVWTQPKKLRMNIKLAQAMSLSPCR